MPVSPFAVARTHAKLPVNRELGVLKTVLRDWLRYTEDTPLTQKEAFPAALAITVKRTPPPAASAGGERRVTSRVERDDGARRVRGLASALSQRLGWRRGSDGLTGATHAYTVRVPLLLYTAVLPWEVQRGLSLTELAIPTGSSAESADDSHAQGDAGPVASSPAHTSPSVPAGANKQSLHQRTAVADAEAPAGSDMTDPYGVVTRSVGAAPQTEASSASPVPGMLFLLDVEGVLASGRLSFWSGAITRAIDVLFFAPQRAAAVADSMSFRRLREGDVAAQVEDNAIAPAVVAKYFPSNELGSRTYTLQLHTHGHLDPFPWLDGRASAGKGDQTLKTPTQGSLRHSVEAPLAEGAARGASAAAALPRYVLETLRGTVRAGVRRALAESLADYRGVHGCTPVSPEDDAEVSMSLELSDALREDLQQKAQLSTHYVSALEQSIAGYAQALSRPLQSDSASAARTPHGDGETDDSDGSRRVPVWLSPTEQVWMSPQELTTFQRKQTRAHEQTPWDAERENLGASASMESDLDSADDARESAGASSSSPSSAATSAVATQEGAADAYDVDLAPDRSRTERVPDFITPARAGGVRSDRRLSHQSPMLTEEDEGRPSYLAPAFEGRHEATTLYPSVTSAATPPASSPSSSPAGYHAELRTRERMRSVSADQLARYPRTRSTMPVLPPVDYELLDLCLRLGVGQSAVLYHWYERILREWGHELKRRRAAAKTTASHHSSSSSGSSSSSTLHDAAATPLADADVLRMHALVHDPSLQVPNELRELVDAVSRARGEGGHAEPVAAGGVRGGRGEEGEGSPLVAGVESPHSSSPSSSFHH